MKLTEKQIERLVAVMAWVFMVLLFVMIAALFTGHKLLGLTIAITFLALSVVVLVWLSYKMTKSAFSK